MCEAEKGWWIPGWRFMSDRRRGVNGEGGMASGACARGGVAVSVVILHF